MASMDHDAAMLRLNDQVGRHVVVFVVRGDVDIAVMSGEGELRHWSSRDPAGLIDMTETARRLAGCYVVGSTVLDVGQDQGAASWSDMVESDGLGESETGLKASWAGRRAALHSVGRPSRGHVGRSGVGGAAGSG